MDALEIYNHINKAQLRVARGKTVFLPDEIYKELLPIIAKSIPLRPLNQYNSQNVIMLGECPVCHNGVADTQNFCEACGSALNWRQDDAKP